MGKFSNIIIVSDFDGTFFSGFNEGYKKNIAEIERFKNEGGIFTFATGRDYYSLLEVDPDAGNTANAPLILANGARLYDIKSKKYIYSYVLNMNLFSEFLEEIYKKYPEVGVRFSCENGLAVPVFNEILQKDMANVSLQNIAIRVIPVKELIKSGEKVYKCVMVHDPEIIDDVRRAGENFEKDINRELFFTKSYGRGLEILNSGTSKGAMAVKLKEYLTRLNGREHRLAAIGDYDNDFDMIKLADYGAAPENALEYVKNAAKIITASCKDGAVADLIQIIERVYC